jgi:putative ABC transport system permease protein
MEQQFYSIYGGFLFIGLFLGGLFMMATVLIIYYKQISEGYDDHDRFKIMQKVGLSKREVKSTIRRQILMVFFLPLAGAVIHICFAFKMISKLLLLFSLTNTNLFMLCTLCTVLVFGVIYAMVYGWTAKIYYRLVEAKL